MQPEKVFRGNLRSGDKQPRVRVHEQRETHGSMAEPPARCRWVIGLEKGSEYIEVLLVTAATPKPGVWSLQGCSRTL